MMLKNPSLRLSVDYVAAILTLHSQFLALAALLSALQLSTKSSFAENCDCAGDTPTTSPMLPAANSE